MAASKLSWDRKASKERLVSCLSLCVVRFFDDTLSRDFDLLFLCLVVWMFD